MTLPMVGWRGAGFEFRQLALIGVSGALLALTACGGWRR